MSRKPTSGRKVLSGRSAASGRKVLSVGDRVPSWFHTLPQVWLDHSQDQDLPALDAEDPDPDNIPTYTDGRIRVTSNSPINRSDHWEFTGDDTWKIEGTPDVHTGFTLFVVAQVTATSGRNYFLNFNSSADSSEIRLRYDADNENFIGQTFDNTGSGSSASINDGGKLKTSKTVVAMRVQEDGFITLKTHQNEALSGAPGSELTILDTRWIGARNGSLRYLNGRVYECIVFGLPLHDSDLDETIGQLAEKWDVS